MTDRPNSGMPQEPAVGVQAPAPQDAEKLSTPEITKTMLDVHAPRQSAHTWKDFFIHITTIVIGLLIAVGLEQSVEFIHHRHRVAEAREALRLERLSNTHRFALATREFYRISPNLQNNIAVFRYLQLHPGAPSSAWPAQLDWSMVMAEFSDAAWKSVQSSGVLEFMERNEVSQYGDLYARLQTLNALEGDLFMALFDARKYAIAADDAEHLTAQQLEREVELLTSLLARYAYYIQVQRNVSEVFPDFTPAPTREDRWAIFHDTFDPVRNKPLLDELDEFYRYEVEIGQAAPGTSAASEEHSP
jgi:hypothetical protein